MHEEQALAALHHGLGMQDHHAMSGESEPSSSHMPDKLRSANAFLSRLDVHGIPTKPHVPAAGAARPSASRPPAAQADRPQHRPAPSSLPDNEQHIGQESLFSRPGVGRPTSGCVEMMHSQPFDCRCRCSTDGVEQAKICTHLHRLNNAVQCRSSKPNGL